MADVTVKEAARLLNLREETIRDHCISGKLSGTKNQTDNSWTVHLSDEITGPPAESAGAPAGEIRPHNAVVTGAHPRVTEYHTRPSERTGAGAGAAPAPIPAEVAAQLDALRQRADLAEALAEYHRAERAAAEDRLIAARLAEASAKAIADERAARLADTERITTQLCQQLAEKDQQIAALLERQREAHILTQGAQELARLTGPADATPGESSAETSPGESPRRSWWRRLLFGD